MSALAALMHRSIDYAGLFPPAKLDMPVAVREYASYQSHPHVELLARFVMPLDRLPEARTAFQDVFGRLEQPWRLAGLLKVGSLPTEQAREQARRSAAAFAELAQVAPRVSIDVIEADLPSDVPQSAGSPLALQDWLSFLQATFFSNAPPAGRVFLELDWRTFFEPAMAALAQSNAYAGVKLRTGGLTAEMVPPPRTVAQFMLCAAQHGLSMKTTAGLHVPVPNDDKSVGGRMHGFLNMLTAALAAYGAKGAQPEIANLLEVADYEDFSLSESTLHCRGFQFSVEEIRELRTLGMVSFGSCSFLEPLEHLRQHGLL